MIVLSLPLHAFAECDFTDGKGVTKVEGGYLYSKECHIAVGQMKYDLGVKDLQIEKLGKALDLKDLAITKADQRADLWMQTSFKLEDRINTIDNMRSSNQWIAFGLGALTMFAAAYAASQLSHH
jgi:hypothetical protein